MVAPSQPSGQHGQPTIPLGRQAARRRAIYAAGFRPEWRELLVGRVSQWNALSPTEHERLEMLTIWLLAEKRWEAAADFELTDEVQLVIAAQAALLQLGLPDDIYRRVRTVLVRSTTYLMHGEYQVTRGVVTRGPLPILGLAQEGTVMIAWDTARRDARHPGTGHNVVFHEFAHQIDMLDGSANGTPPLATQHQFDRWVAVCTAVYENVRAGVAGASLRAYAGVNPGEFFAVATEVFFDDPHGLRRDQTDLYDVLREFYRQDPGERVSAPDDGEVDGALS